MAHTRNSVKTDALSRNPRQDCVCQVVVVLGSVEWCGVEMQDEARQDQKIPSLLRGTQTGFGMESCVRGHSHEYVSSVLCDGFATDSELPHLSKPFPNAVAEGLGSSYKRNRKNDLEREKRISMSSILYILNSKSKHCIYRTKNLMVSQWQRVSLPSPK